MCCVVGNLWNWNAVGASDCAQLWIGVLSGFFPVLCLAKVQLNCKYLVVKGIHFVRTIWVDIFISVQCFLNCEWLLLRYLHFFLRLFFLCEAFREQKTHIDTNFVVQQQPQTKKRHEIKQQNLFWCDYNKFCFGLATWHSHSRFNKIYSHMHAALNALWLIWRSDGVINIKLDFSIALTRCKHKNHFTAQLFKCIDLFRFVCSAMFSRAVTFLSFSFSNFVALARWCLYSHRNKTPRDSDFNYIVCHRENTDEQTDSMEPTTLAKYVRLHKCCRWLRLLRNTNYNTFILELFSSSTLAT